LVWFGLSTDVELGEKVIWGVGDRILITLENS
jgi:hypothetical protein